MEDNVWLESLCKEVVFTIPSGEIEGKMINSSCIYELEVWSMKNSTFQPRFRRFHVKISACEAETGFLLVKLTNMEGTKSVALKMKK